MMRMTSASRLKNGREHIVDRAVDEHGRVKADLDRGSFRHRFIDRAAAPRLTAIATSSGLATACLTMPIEMAVCAIIAALAPDIGRSKFDPRHIAERHLQAARRLER